MSYDCYGDCGDYIKLDQECYQCISCTKRYHVLCANTVVVSGDIALCKQCLLEPTVKMFWLDTLAKKVENAGLTEGAGFITVSAPNPELLEVAENITKVLQTITEPTNGAGLERIIDVLKEGNTNALDKHNKVIESDDCMQASLKQILEAMNAHNKCISEQMVTQNKLLAEIVETQKKFLETYEKMALPARDSDATARIVKLEQGLLRM